MSARRLCAPSVRASCLLIALIPAALLGQSDPDAYAIPDGHDPERVRTIPADCQLPEERLERIRARVRQALEMGLEDPESAARLLDGLRQSAVDRAVGFHVTDSSIFRLEVLRDVRIVLPGIDCVEDVEAALFRALVVEAPEVVFTVHDLLLRTFAIELASPPPFRRWLASRTRDRLLWLHGLYREVVGRGAASAGVDLMLLGLADEMQRSLFRRSKREARELLRRIGGRGETRFAARYALGFLSEIVGDYREAAVVYGRLAKQRPDDLELALREAVNREREGDTRAARRTLERLTTAEGEEWARVVGFQELARLAASGSGDEVAILRRALALFPDEPQLQIQLASYLGEDWSSIDALAAELDAATVGNGSSPRLVYDSLRRSELDSRRLELERLAVAGRAALAAALR